MAAEREDIELVEGDQPVLEFELSDIDENGVSTPTDLTTKTVEFYLKRGPAISDGDESTQIYSSMIPTEIEVVDAIAGEIAVQLETVDLDHKWYRLTVTTADGRPLTYKYGKVRTIDA